MGSGLKNIRILRALLSSSLNLLTVPESFPARSSQRMGSGRAPWKAHENEQEGHPGRGNVPYHARRAGASGPNICMSSYVHVSM